VGTVMSLSRVTQEQLERAAADPSRVDDLLVALADAPDEVDGYLDKAWAGIQFLLDAADAGLDLEGAGDVRIGGDGDLVGWSDRDVAGVARLLQALPFERLAAGFEPARMVDEGVYPSMLWQRDGALGYLRSHYETLVRFFTTAAATESAVVREFG
jgi:hypothetical protein